MNINDFIERNNIAIFAKADLKSKTFDIIKRDVELESYDLFQQLILFGNTDSLCESIDGQILPRIWTQGNTKCIVCKPNNEQLVALFYDNNMNATDNYFHAKELNLLLKEIF